MTMIFSRTVVGTVVAVLLATVSPIPRCHADVVLDFKSTSESVSGKESKGGFQVWLGDSAARLDLSGSASYIVDLRQNRMVILDHAKHTFNVLTLPVRLEQYFEGEAASNYEMAKSLLKPTVRLEAQGQSEVIGEWGTDLYVWSITYSSTYKVEMRNWLSRSLKVDENLYNSLMSAYNSLDIDRSQWIDRVLETEGIAVRSEVAIERYQGTWKTTVVLESIRELPTSEDRYRAPSTYSQTRFDTSKYAVVIERPH